MGYVRLQFAAMVIFVAGFVLAGSGWSPVISWAIQGRNSWSVCGQALCLCQPTQSIEPVDPFCPLCKADTDQPQQIADAPRRLPSNPQSASITMASETGFASIFLSFLFGTPLDTDAYGDDATTAQLTQERCPRNPSRDLSTPPPKG